MVLEIKIEKEFPQAQEIPYTPRKSSIALSYTMLEDEEEALKEQYHRLLADRLGEPDDIPINQIEKAYEQKQQEDFDEDFLEAMSKSYEKGDLKIDRETTKNVLLLGESMMRELMQTDPLQRAVVVQEQADNFFEDLDSMSVIKAGNTFEEEAQLNLFNEVVAWDIAQKLQDVGWLETLSKQLLGTVGYSSIGSKAGSVLGPLGSIGGAALGTILYPKLGTATGHASIATIGKEFNEKATEINYTSKDPIEARYRVRDLINETFTDANREYWYDIAEYVTTAGTKEYLDANLLTGAVIGKGIQGMAYVSNKLFKTVKNATQAYKVSEAKVANGEILTPKALSLTDSTVPNEDLSPRIIDLEYVGADNGVPRYSAEGYKSIGQGETVDAPHYTGGIVALDYNKYLSGVNKRNDVTPSNTILDLDIDINGAMVHIVGGGSDNRHIMSYTKALQKTQRINNEAVKDRNVLTVYSPQRSIRTEGYQPHRYNIGSEEFMVDELIDKGWWKPYDVKDIQQFIKEEYKHELTIEEAQKVSDLLDSLKKRIANKVIKSKQSLNRAFEDELRLFEKNNEIDIKQLSEEDIRNQLFIRDMTEHFLEPTKNVKMPRIIRYELKNADKIYYEGHKNSPFVRKAVSDLKKKGYEGFEFISKLGSKGVTAMVSKDGKVFLTTASKKQRVGSVSLNKYGGVLYETESIYKASGKRAFPIKYGNGYVVGVVDDFSTLNLDKPVNVKYNAPINPKEVEVDIK